MRRGALFAILAFSAGCGGGGPAPLPTGRISAYFPAGGVADTIEVDAIDRLALRRAELVAPDGRTTAAISIAARPAPSDSAGLALPTGAYAGGASGVGGGPGSSTVRHHRLKACRPTSVSVPLAVIQSRARSSPTTSDGPGSAPVPVPAS